MIARTLALLATAGALTWLGSVAMHADGFRCFALYVIGACLVIALFAWAVIRRDRRIHFDPIMHWHRES